MKIIKSYLENNPCYQAGEKIKVKGLMLHSVGCSQIMNVVKLMNIFENSKNENTKLLLFTHFELDLFRE